MALKNFTRAGISDLLSRAVSGSGGAADLRLMLLETIPGDIQAVANAGALDVPDDTSYSSSYANGLAVTSVAVAIDATNNLVKITGDAMTFTGVTGAENVVGVALIRFDTNLAGSMVWAVYDTTDFVADGNNIIVSPSATWGYFGFGINATTVPA